MDSFWLLAPALFIFGATGSVGMVIWGTLLQRRVPPHLLVARMSADETAHPLDRRDTLASGAEATT